jgi:hypothetical protein
VKGPGTRTEWASRAIWSPTLSFIVRGKGQCSFGLHEELGPCSPVHWKYNRGRRTGDTEALGISASVVPGPSLHCTEEGQAVDGLHAAISPSAPCTKSVAEGKGRGHGGFGLHGFCGPQPIPSCTGNETMTSWASCRPWSLWPRTTESVARKGSRAGDSGRVGFTSTVVPGPTLCAWGEGQRRSGLHIGHGPYSPVHKEYSTEREEGPGTVTPWASRWWWSPALSFMHGGKDKPSMGFMLLLVP